MTVARPARSTSSRCRTAAPSISTASWCADVTTHPAFRNSVQSAGALYDFQAQPENIELMTFKPDGSNRRVNRAWQMPKSYDEMVQRRKALQAWAARALRLHGPLAGPCRLGAGRPAHGHRGVQEAQPRPRQGASGLFRLRHPQRPLPHLRDHQSAGRARQGLGRSRPTIWSRASSTRTPAASPSAAPRCSAPARSWPTRCWSPTCSR